MVEQIRSTEKCEGFTLCLAENKPNAGGGWGKRWGGVEKDSGVELTDGGGSAGDGGGTGARNKSVIRGLELSAPGGPGGATGLGAQVSLRVLRGGGSSVCRLLLVGGCLGSMGISFLWVRGFFEGGGLD